MIAAWNNLVSRSYHLWGWWHTFGFLLAFSLFAAFAAGIWFTLWQWYQLAPILRETYSANDFLTTIAAYGVLFLLLNLGATLLYLFMMGWGVLWMGRYGYLPEMDYALCCRVALVTGVPFLTLVLVFGQMLEMKAGMVAVMMLLHAAWLRSIKLPPPQPPQQD